MLREGSSPRGRRKRRSLRMPKAPESGRSRPGKTLKQEKRLRPGGAHTLAVAFGAYIAAFVACEGIGGFGSIHAGKLLTVIGEEADALRIRRGDLDPSLLRGHPRDLHASRSVEASPLQRRDDRRSCALGRLDHVPAASDIP